MLKWMVSQAKFGGGGGEPVDQRQSLPGGGVGVGPCHSLGTGTRMVTPDGMQWGEGARPGPVDTCTRARAQHRGVLRPPLPGTGVSCWVCS